MIENTNPASVRLVTLAAELGEPIEAIARELADDAFVDAAGFRAITASRSAKLFRDRAQQRDRAEESSKRRAAEARARAGELREAGIERGRAAREAAARGETRIQRLEITASTEFPGLDALPDAGALARLGDEADYAGGASTPRPNSLDWARGVAEGGAVFGPSEQDREAQREARKLNRLAKGGAK